MNNSLNDHLNNSIRQFINNHFLHNNIRFLNDNIRNTVGYGLGVSLGNELGLAISDHVISNCEYVSLFEAHDEQVAQSIEKVIDDE